VPVGDKTTVIRTEAPIWFHDVRTPYWRMRIAADDVGGQAVIGFWHRHRCAGTVKISWADSAALVREAGLAIGDEPSAPSGASAGADAGQGLEAGPVLAEAEAPTP